MYATFAKEAREEGFDHIADLFEMVGAIEKEHRNATAGCSGVEDKLVFSRDGDCVWQCSNRTYRCRQTGAGGLPGLCTS